MSQFALPLDIGSAHEDTGYLVTDCNLQTHRQLEQWDRWPNGTAILIGSHGAGKQAMARKFVSQSGGRYVADAHGVADDKLFHLWNQSQSDKQPLLLISSRDVSRWDIQLPDLKSRLAASILIEIGPPDEAMIIGLFQKYFALRGLSISEDALSYLGKRMERSYQNVQLLAQKMNVLAIERKKPITRAIAKAALAQHEAESAKPEIEEG
ncbi:DnaA ATPase domain-containing protein [Sphingorhabdus sp. Alg231-15]|uniref:DnaA ATPase domain-containing protein n=1 Tax=Sphingorhabdus sp. Alg231-15 TaxID=1922222 RepID=UPI000D55B365